MAVHNACVMASVTLSVEDRAVYDDAPQVAVNPIALVGSPLTSAVRTRAVPMHWSQRLTRPCHRIVNGN